MFETSRVSDGHYFVVVCVVGIGVVGVGVVLFICSGCDCRVYVILVGSHDWIDGG